MNTTASFLPFALPAIGEEEIAEVVDSLRSGWITTGPKTARFEGAFKEFVGSKYALSVNSATAGLHLALESLGVGVGDYVITTVHTFTATAEVIRYLGADPIFVDIDSVTLNISVDGIRQALSDAVVGGKSVKAVIPVHFAGLSCDMTAIHSVCREYGVRVVEDAAHAFPATCGGRMVGTLSDITVFSFYATKTIATGEGGMITTDDDALAARIKIMRLHGINRDVWDRYTAKRPSWYYEVVAPGFKYNMTDIAASLGIHQLAKAEKFRSRREDICRQYSAAFEGLPLQLPPVAQGGDVHAWHLYVLRLLKNEVGLTRDSFIEEMFDAGIGTSVHFIPLHMQPYWRDRYNLSLADFPVSTQVYMQSVSLPVYPTMSQVDVERVIHAVRDICGRYVR